MWSFYELHEHNPAQYLKFRIKKINKNPTVQKNYVPQSTGNFKKVSSINVRIDTTPKGPVMYLKYVFVPLTKDIPVTNI